MWMAVNCAVIALVACHSRVEQVPFDHCARNPPDSVPLPPILARSELGKPGDLTIEFHDPAGRIVDANAIIDRMMSVPSRAGTSRIAGLAPGQHRLTVRSYGYGQRDTVLTQPADSALHVTVPLSAGGGLGRCSVVYSVREVPWWRFW